MAEQAEDDAVTARALDIEGEMATRGTDATQVTQTGRGHNELG